MELYSKGAVLNMMVNAKVITVKQLPVIEQTLDEISKTIDLEIERAKSIVPVDANKTSIALKKSRSDLRKDFEWIEVQRKAVKTEIMRPYLEFEELYKSKISDKYKEADIYFKEKIDEIETKAKTEKREKVKDYFIDLALSSGISGISFEDLNIDIKISGSFKSYCDRVKEKIEKISSDFKAIDAMNLGENEKLELILEYKKTFDLSSSVLKIEQKKKEIEKLKSPETQKEILEAPEDDEVLEMTFTVRGSKKKLKALKEYLIENKLI